MLGKKFIQVTHLQQTKPSENELEIKQMMIILCCI